MCGIAGLLAARGLTAPIRPLVETMAETLRHRGPDSKGVWVDSNKGVALAHRRLAIVDLSSTGHQPATSKNGRLVLTFNGEIYNHRQLRQTLAKEGLNVPWSGHSDTETLLECFSAWGIEKTLKRVRGMFALGCWDAFDGQLHLARDRFGEKPLYYGFLDGTLVFASELKSFAPIGSKSLNLDLDSLDSYMKFGYVPEPWSIYREIRKIKAGSWQTFDLRAKGFDDLAPAKTFWSSEEVIWGGDALPSPYRSDRSAVDALENILTESVESQLMGDVPIGAFLSGGVDSSLITAIAQKIAPKPIETFTVGFADQRYDEAPFAGEISSYLGTSHNEIYLSSQNVLDLIPSLPLVYDEPFADSSQVPTLAVSALARGRVAVSLSGDGGDELFGGYSRYSRHSAIFTAMGLAPAALRALSQKTLSRLLKTIASRYPALPGSGGENRAALKFPIRAFETLERALGAGSEQELYEGRVSFSEGVNFLNQNPEISGREGARFMPLRDRRHRMMAFDTISYLPGDILAKVDRAGMAYSLETRMPFLDHRVAEFAWQLPADMKFRNGKGKWILRELLRNHLPPKLFERPKMGFNVPLDLWLRTCLKSWASELLSKETLAQIGVLNSIEINLIWQEHLREEKDWSNQIWTILMFISWVRSPSSLLCELEKGA